MDNLFFLSFSNQGFNLSNKLMTHFGGKAIRVSNLHECIKNIFKTGNILVFVGACGIAVRGIAPFIGSKMTDPAVVVVDDLGKFVISLLSGHLGGANEYSNKIAVFLNATPVITTATDINSVFSIDIYALKNNYYIANPDMIKHISSSLLKKEPVGLHSEFETQGQLPENILFDQSLDVGIYIGFELSRHPFPKTLSLCPKAIHIGIGARKNISYEVLNRFFNETLLKLGISIQTIASISSIDLKKEEPAILKLAETYNLKFVTYTAEELSEWDDLVTKSDFVKQTTGVYNVCEASAYRSSKNGKMILEKTSCDGVTLAVAQEFWKVIF